jgi:F-type H+-transporting ATPase subunit b
MKLLVAILPCAIGLLAATTVYASDTGGGWREIYDIAMKWVNFAILAFLLVKFLRDPIRNYFSNQRAGLTDKIDSLEKEKEEKLHGVNEARRELESSGERLAALKEKIIHRGEREKEALIKTARDQSRLMLEGAQRKVAYRIEQARAEFRDELIDTAVTAAMKHFPAHMTDADNERLLQTFLDDPEMKGKVT